MVTNNFLISNSELEDKFDEIKILVLQGLIKEKIVNKTEANEWAETHSFVVRKKSVFRTLSDKWKNEKVEESSYTISLIQK